MHSKQKGALGESKVLADLLKRNIAVFPEFGDLSVIDFFVYTSNREIGRIQVKYASIQNNTIQVKTTKSGPGYTSRYSDIDVDVFAIYVPQKDIILYINSLELLSYRKSMTFRFKPTLNNQKVRKIEDYMDFEKALRGHTPCTLSKLIEGEEMVQTASV